ncbi:aminotransferase class I/II-fold pyridoxal phosphate-dependent enzyme, partial [Patescibacteria group bacterium]|nr:aminotransferase class I/II-fold pyridoxal phosphate-dependent enzyme [Patescibacteria group bacterium]
MFLSKICQHFKPISISLSPNTEKDDIFLALKLIFQPWKWKVSVSRRDNQRKSANKKLEQEFKKYFRVKYAFSFNSGRTALMAILEALELNQGDEILLQSFTCNAVVNPILWTRLKPVFIDCDEKTFNIDCEDLKRKIGPKSKAVLVQHTFGLPAD